MHIIRTSVYQQANTLCTARFGSYKRLLSHTVHIDISQQSENLLLS